MTQVWGDLGWESSGEVTRRQLVLWETLSPGAAKRVFHPETGSDSIRAAPCQRLAFLSAKLGLPRTCGGFGPYSRESTERLM